MRLNPQLTAAYETDYRLPKEVMTKNPIALSPNHSLAYAILMMAEKKFGAVPVVDKYNSLVGILTKIDIFRLWAQIIRDEASK